MKNKIFLDTNIIMYAHDRSSRDKHAVAREIMDYLWESRKGVISVQVLQEFFEGTKRLSVNDSNRLLQLTPTKLGRE